MKHLPGPVDFWTACGRSPREVIEAGDGITGYPAKATCRECRELQHQDRYFRLSGRLCPEPRNVLVTHWLAPEQVEYAGQFQVQVQGTMCGEGGFIARDPLDATCPDCLEKIFCIDTHKASKPITD